MRCNPDRSNWQILLFFFHHDITDLSVGRTRSKLSGTLRNNSEMAIFHAAHGNQDYWTTIKHLQTSRYSYITKYLPEHSEYEPTLNRAVILKNSLHSHWHTPIPCSTLDDTCSEENENEVTNTQTRYPTVTEHYNLWCPSLLTPPSLAFNTVGLPFQQANGKTTAINNIHSKK